MVDITEFVELKSKALKLPNEIAGWHSINIARMCVVRVFFM